MLSSEMNFAKRKKNKARLLLQGCTTEIILKISDCVIDGDDDDDDDDDICTGEQSVSML